jgi:hypothetical protein
LFIRYDNENHHHVPDRLNPSFEGHAREIRPKNARKTKEEIDQNRPVCVEERKCPSSPMNDDTYSHDQQYQEESPVDRIAIELDIACARGRPPQPD